MDITPLFGLIAITYAFVQLIGMFTVLAAIISILFWMLPYA